MTDMDKMMIEKVARAIAASFESGSPDIAKNMRMDWQTWEPEARAAISAYNPDDRLREAATTFLEFWQQEPNGAVTVRAAIRLGSALSPLPQGDT